MMKTVMLFVALLGMASAKAPTDKVIELLTELKAKMESDGAAEQLFFEGKDNENMIFL